MSDTFIAFLTALAFIFSSIAAIISGVTAIKTKKADVKVKEAKSEDFLSQINERIQKRVEDSYDKLILVKDQQIKELEMNDAENKIRIQCLEKDAIVRKKHAVESVLRIEKLEKSLSLMKKFDHLYKRYVNYLLKGIECDKGSTFKPLDLDNFDSDTVALNI